MAFLKGVALLWWYCSKCCAEYFSFAYRLSLPMEVHHSTVTFKLLLLLRPDKNYIRCKLKNSVLSWKERQKGELSYVKDLTQDRGKSNNLIRKMHC